MQAQPLQLLMQWLRVQQRLLKELRHMTGLQNQPIIQKAQLLLILRLRLKLWAQLSRQTLIQIQLGLALTLLAMLREKQLVTRLALVEAAVLRLELEAQAMVLVRARLGHPRLEPGLVLEMLVLEGLVERVLVAQMAAVLAAILEMMLVAAILEMMLVAAQLKLKQQRHLQHWLNSLQKIPMLNIAGI